MWSCAKCGHVNQFAYCSRCGSYPPKSLPKITITAQHSAKPGRWPLVVTLLALLAMSFGAYRWTAEHLRRRSLTPTERAFEDRRGAEPATSMWSGLAVPVKKWMDLHLHDPRSLEVVEASKVVPSKRWPEYWTQKVRYRSKNGFGALVIAEEEFLMTEKEVVQPEEVQRREREEESRVRRTNPRSWENTYDRLYKGGKGL